MRISENSKSDDQNLGGGAHRPDHQISDFLKMHFTLGTRWAGRTQKIRFYMLFSGVSDRATHPRYQKLCNRFRKHKVTAV